MSTFIGRDGELRLYDSTATPFYLPITFEQVNLSAPIGRGRPQEQLTHVLNNLEYRPVDIAQSLAPLSITFSLYVNYLNWVKTREAFGVDFASASSATTNWTVDGDTWLSTYGDTTIYDHSGTAITRPSAFSDSRKVCSNVEAIWTSPESTIMGFQWGEVYFDPAALQFTEQSGPNTLQASGLIYGAIAPITGFTAGNES